MIQPSGSKIALKFVFSFGRGGASRNFVDLCTYAPHIESNGHHVQKCVWRQMLSQIKTILPPNMNKNAPKKSCRCIHKGL